MYKGSYFTQADELMRMKLTSPC